MNYIPENFFVLERRRQKNELLNYIREHRDTTNIDRCLGEFSMKTGLRVAVLRVYLEEIKMAGLIE